MKVFNIEITQQEIDEIARRHFEATSPLVLKSYPRKMKKKVAVLCVIAQCFDKDTIYTKKANKRNTKDNIR